MSKKQQGLSRMVTLTESVHVKAPPKAAWKLISNFEETWLNSNPDHLEIMVLGQYKRHICDGFAYWQREKVGRATVEYIAKLEDVTKEKAFSWSTVANYDICRTNFKLEMGGTFLIEEVEKGFTLRHDFWIFNHGNLKGLFFRWFVLHLFGHKRAISKHYRTELGYYKEKLEKDEAEATCH